MQAFHRNCIFCFKDLPNKRKGKGEHIVPELLHGSVCIKDVCRDCNSKLGSEADHMALEDYRIIDAINALDLPDLQKKLLDRANSKTTDIHTGEEIPTSTKDGKPKIVRHVSKDGIVGNDERGAFEEARKSLKREPPPHLTPEKIDKIFEQLKPAYEKMEPGEFLHAPVLGRSFRKGRAKTSWQFKVTPYASRRLIAKIAYEAATIFLPADRCDAFRETLEKLRLHALNGEPIEDYLICYPPDWREEEYDPKKAKYEHSITFMYWDEFIPIDISLFGLAQFRICLLPKQGGAGALREGDNVIRGGTLLMTFEPGQPKRKLMGWLPDGSDVSELHDFTGYL